MRCATCGMPLSPSRTHCPRCGTAIAEAGKRSSGKPAWQGTPSSQSDMLPPGGTPNIPGNQFSNEQQWSPYGPVSPHGAQGSPGIQGGQPIAQVPFPGNNDSTIPMQMGSQGQAFGQQNQAWGPPMAATPSPYAVPMSANQQTPWPFPQAPASPGMSATERRTTRPGFTIAALCIVAGGLILTFVFILSQSLSPAPTTQSMTATDTQHSTATAATNAQATSTASVASTPTAAVATPTVALPAQQYVASAQMASAVDERSGIPITLATTFNVGQKIYLTLTLNPQGQSGAICSLWYINSQHIQDDDFSLAIKPTSTHAYEFISSGTAGPGYVEVYWASSEQCTDKTLAQRVQFTVN